MEMNQASRSDGSLMVSSTIGSFTSVHNTKSRLRIDIDYNDNDGHTPC
jgi:hypothetical protein